ncbi:MAG: hypothetical protein ABI396_05655 [Ktedonobacteraceae bacterium]
MNILIVVGLLLVGIAAIVGVVLIGFSDQRKETVHNTTLKKEHEIKASAPVAPVQLTTPTEPKEVVPSKQTVSGPNHSSTGRTSLTTLEGVQKLPTLNGQFHEMANEIRSLHQQASQMEQRLSILTEMINHLEDSQSDTFDPDNIDEDEQTHVPSENTFA